MASKSKLSVVLDLGTSKLVAVAGYKNDAGKIEISGIANVPSKGLKRGVIFNIEEVAISVRKVLAELEEKIKEKIEQVDVAYAGQHLKTIDYKSAKITADESVVTQFDIDHLYNEAQKVELENDFKVIRVIPTSFLIDNETTVINPVGITGRKVEASYKLVILPETYLVNMRRVFDKTDVQLGDIMLSSLAISEAVLTEDEKEIGVIVLDIGAGTTKMAVYYENMLLHTTVIPFGGDVVTQDIKEGCSILLKWAQKLKIQYGQALGDFADEQKVVTIPGFNGWEPKEISFKSLAFIIQARLEEIVDSIYHQIEKSGVEEHVGAGIVITGGTSNIENIIPLVEFRTGLNARIANLALQIQPKNKDFQKPENHTALGLLSLVLNKSAVSKKTNIKVPNTNRPPGGRLTPWFNNIVQGVLNLVDDESEDTPLN